MKPTVKLENWQLLNGRLYGCAYGHPGHPDGTYVCTSQVQERDEHRAVTLNTVYELGKKAGEA